MSNIQIQSGVLLSTWYDKRERIWYGQYIDENGNQLQPCWFANTRDQVLIFRPEVTYEYVR